MFEGRKIKKLKQEIELSGLQIEIEGLGQIKSIINESNAVQAEDDEASWTLLGADSANRKLGDEDQDKLKSQVTKAFYKTPHGRNIIRLFEKYVTGRGFALTPKSTLKEVDEVRKDFWKRNRMELKKKEIVRRTMRDGECFIRFFIENGKVSIRFMLSQLVKDPDDKKTTDAKVLISSGIETSADDIETVLAYWYKNKRIPAEEVMHIKILVDSDVKRGRSLLEPIIDYLWMYRDWLKDRMKLNKVRATVALIKKVTGTPAQAANLKGNQETVNRLNPDGTPKQKAPVGVSVITTNQNVDYKLEAPNLQAADVQHDGRTILLAIAAGVGLPEYMITSDASNGNYSCESADTEILTLRGWIDQSLLTEEDQIATVNQKTNELEYQHPTAIHRYYHEGFMVQIKGTHNLDMIVTENHRMWVTQHQHRKVNGKLLRKGLKEYNFIQAGKLIKHNYITQTKVEWDGIGNTVVIPGIERFGGNGATKKPKEDRKCDIKVWASFLGYFISEGWILDNGSKIWTVGLSQNKGNIADKISKTLNDMPINWNAIYSKDGKMITWTVVDKALWHFLKDTVGAGAYNKKIPNYAKQWDTDTLKILIETLLDGDGSRVGAYSRYFTVSKQLADDVMEVAIKAGYISGIKTQMKNGVWPVAIKNQKLVYITPVRHIKKIKYSGIVWCPEVPNGLFIGRRNGISHIHGNSLMTAEGPAVMEFEDWQDFFAIYFSEMYDLIIRAAISAKLIPENELKVTKEYVKIEGKPDKQIEKSEIVLTSTECSITFPDIVSRDIQKETTAIITQMRESLCSKQTASARLDLDYEDEQEFIKQENEEAEDSGEPTKDEEDEMEDEPEDEKAKS